MAVFFVLGFKREFWFVAFTLGSLAAGTESLANLMHFQLSNTFGYALLSAICWAFATGIASRAPPHNNKISQERHIPPTCSDHIENPDWSPR